jgi:NAD(P)-dependent dehydrogenase (short-subunit alcohol dehydrogenase family)
MKIVITGVTRGLGRALTEEFIRAGHTVIGCGRSGDAIFDLRMTHPAPHDFTVLDVGLDNKVAIWAAKVLENDSPPDLLINNAGDHEPSLARLGTRMIREFTRLVDANIRGTQNVIRHFVPAMVAKKKGRDRQFDSDGSQRFAEVGPYACPNGPSRASRRRSRRSCHREWRRCRSIPASSTPTCCAHAG